MHLFKLSFLRKQINVFSTHVYNKTAYRIFQKYYCAIDNRNTFIFREAALNPMGI